MDSFVIFFLIADGILIWMLRDAWGNDEVWLTTRMGARQDNKAIWWMTMARLGSLLVLSLVGTVAALLA